MPKPVDVYDVKCPKCGMRGKCVDPMMGPGDPRTTILGVHTERRDELKRLREEDDRSEVHPEAS